MQRRAVGLPQQRENVVVKSVRGGAYGGEHLCAHLGDLQAGSVSLPGEVAAHGAEVFELRTVACMDGAVTRARRARSL